MKRLKFVFFFIGILAISGCVTNPKYTPTKESAENFEIVFTDEAGK